MEPPRTLSSVKYLLFPEKNHWVKRICLVFAFIFFDYFVTLLFCHFPQQEANMYARGFMQLFGIPLGLTLFVWVANFPIYATLSLDSHIVRFPSKIAAFVEVFMDLIFAWFVAGLHFRGGTSWFWSSSELVRQFLGTVLYLVIALLIIKPCKSHCND